MYEYKVVVLKVRDAEAEINRLAQDGWRVVSTSLNSGVSLLTSLAPLIVTLERKVNGL